MNNEPRQATRGKDGRYAKMPECPRCGKRGTMEPAYPKSAGGSVRDNSKWANEFICTKCIKQESK